MADEAENTQPEDQSPTEAPQEPQAESGGDVADGSGAEEALQEASSIADDVAAQADDGAEMSDEEAAALAAAMSAISGLGSDTSGVNDAGSAETAGSPFDSPELGESISAEINSDLELLSDVQMNVRIELGRTRMFVEDVLRLGDGAVVELDKLAGDPVDVFVNDRKVARGEVLVLNDNFCVRISEILDLRDN